MPKVKSNPEFLNRLKDALIQDLGTNKINAEIEWESLPPTRLYRVTVVAPEFKHLKHSERQSVVWRIAERTLSPDDQLRISMILTLTKAEVQGDE